MSEARQEFYVSTRGRDSWSGLLADPAIDGSDGPFATLERARDVVRGLKETGQLWRPIVVWVRGGRYARCAPLTFGPEDSAPVTYAAYPGEEPIIDGGQRIGGWRTEQVGSRLCWVTVLPEVAAGRWYFRQLFVNGARRSRPRVPKQDYFWIEEAIPAIDFSSWHFSEVNLFAGTDSFKCAAGDIQPWRNLGDVEVVALHWWIEERMPIAAFDADSGTVRSSRRSMFALRDDATPRYARYYVDNVFEALSEPGEWYLDRQSGTLYYLPLDGEDPNTADVFAPRAEQLLLLQGQPEAGRCVEFLRFTGLGFEHSDWCQPQGRHVLLDVEHSPFPLQLPGVSYASAHQAACSVPGSLVLEGARHCAIEDCRIAHVGGYGIEVAEGCHGTRLAGNTICDLGAGGIKVYGCGVRGAPSRRTGYTHITDNHIEGGGRVFHSAVGVLLIHGYGSEIAHNHIHDLFYSGISCGWLWRYGDSISKNNHIEHNHIHDIGQGLLSDMGGIYTLGAQPGTVIRGNLIHDVRKRNYGGWAIYLDEGSSHILVERNVCFDTSSQPFHQHFGRENIIRNNIFAFGGEGQVALGRGEAHVSFTFERNIVITDGEPLFVGGYGCRLARRNFLSDLNLFWDVSGRPLSGFDGDSYTLERLRSLGYDTHSLVADPCCRDVGRRDFALAEGSPALTLGFEPFDIADVGPRPQSERGAFTPVAVEFFP